MLHISELERRLIARKYWLLDGAIGTELEKRGYITSLPLWTAFAASDCPDLLARIYKEYMEAGSHILTANTFRISYYLFEREKHLDRFEVLLQNTCDLARKCLPESNQYLLAASIATLEDCYRPDQIPDQPTLFKYHRLQLAALLNCHVDFVLAETVNTVMEARILLQLSNEMHIPLIISLISNGRGQLLSGEKLEELIPFINEYNPVAVALNCRSISELLIDTQILADLYPGIKGVYSNAPGVPHPTKGWDAQPDAARQLSDFVQKVAKSDFRIFGGCCGTTPEMIQSADQTLKKLNIRT